MKNVEGIEGSRLVFPIRRYPDDVTVPAPLFRKVAVSRGERGRELDFHLKVGTFSYLSLHLAPVPPPASRKVLPLEEVQYAIIRRNDRGPWLPACSSPALLVSIPIHSLGL